MTAPLEIRRVDYGDPLVRPMLVDLDHEYGRRYGHTLGDLDEEVRRERARFAPPDGGLVLLLEEGVPVAGGAFRRWDAETAELKRVWTATTHRRRGLGRRVLDALEADVAARGYRRVHLTTGPRQPEASALYLAAGYTPGYDRTLPPERIGPHPFDKILPVRTALGQDRRAARPAVDRGPVGGSGLGRAG